MKSYKTILSPIRDLNQSVYDKPKYYDIAFGFVDIKKQVDLFEEFMDRFSGIKVKTVLDIGCGTGSQLIELAHRGYRVSGIDLSSQMLRYLKKRAGDESVTVETIKSDMCHFKMKEEVDFAFIMMGTISYIRNNIDFLRHLSSISASLKSGGLYLIENMRLDWSNQTLFMPQQWTVKKGNVMVKTIYRLKLVDALNQTLEETLRLEVKDRGKAFTLMNRTNTKQIFPQELLELLNENGQFEFLGWFDKDKAIRLKKADRNNIIVLRRK